MPTTNKEGNKTPKSTKQNKQIAKLQAEIETLQKKLTEQEEITKRAQSDYFRYKLDMDAYMARAEEAKQTAKIDALVNMGTHMLPFLTQLQQSIDHIPKELEQNTRVAGIQLIQQKSLQEMNNLGISPVVAKIGTDPNLTLHIPINMQDVKDKKLKGKIVQVVEPGWKYEKDGHLQVISPAKIVVGT